MIIIIVFILISNSYINSQTFKLGITSDVLLGNENINHQFGPDLILDYSLKRLPVSIEIHTRFYVTEISSRKLSFIYDNNLLSVGASINYSPIVSRIEPYIGLGLFYNFNNIETVGNGDYERLLNYPRGNFSPEIIGGLKLFADKPFNIIIEAAQTFNNTGKIKIFNVDITPIFIKEEDISFNSFFIKAGILFKI